jgi:hypothetical protein
MVTKFFRRLGIVRFVRGLIKQKRFQRAFKKCDRLNREKPSKHIVVCYDNRPLVLDKPAFRELKRKGYFRGVAWGTMVKMQVTKKDFQ